ncbi:hypothetical protein FRB97_009651 [Tulasnella sp. 331]|nr:hypothetical protein FRB97_009651 [Tulasnella sp. 331]
MGDSLTTRGSQIKGTPWIAISDAYHSNPFDLLPTELITRILVSASFRNSNSQDTVRSIRRGISSPLTSSQVCKAWRDIVLGTPQAWITLTIAVKAKSATIVGEHLKRSKDLALHIDLLVNDSNDSFKSTTDFFRLTNSMLHLPSRIHTLRVIGNSSSSVVDTTAWTGRNSAWSAIEELELEVHGEDDGGEGLFVLRGLGGIVEWVSALRSLTISGFRMQQAFDLERWKWRVKQLEKLHLKNCDAFVLQVLEAFSMPTLVTLAIDCSVQSIRRSVFLRAPTKALPSLRFMALYNIWIFDMVEILHLAPNITNLALRLDGGWGLDKALHEDFHHLSTLILTGPSVKIKEVATGLRSRVEDVRVLEWSAAVVQPSNLREVEDLEWIKAHTTLRPLPETELELGSILERWEAEI